MKMFARIPYLSSDPIGMKLPLRYWIAGFFFIELVWTFVGGAVTYLSMEGTRNFPWSSASWTIYLYQHVNFLVLFAAVAFFAHSVVRIPLRRYVTDARQFRWKLFWFAALVWLVGIGIATVVTIAIEPESVMVNTTTKLWDRLLLMTLALVFTPLQCIAEELLFRTTLWRMLEPRLRRTWVVGTISGIVFTIAHLSNIEVQSASFNLPILLYYFLSGVLFMEMTRIHRGTEAAFGAHIANNLFLVLVVNYSGSSLPSDPWLIQQAPVIWLDLMVLAVCSFIIIRYGSSTRFQ
jgi:membrane protease YdiL (CAAX protease family)